MALPLRAVDRMPHVAMAAHGEAHTSDEALRSRVPCIHTTPSLLAHTNDTCLKHSTAQHSTAQHSTAQHSTAQHMYPGT
jgi:hypothetical protein